MSSKKTENDWFAIDLERDMPLTSADLEALAGARHLRSLTGDDYQHWIDLLAAHHPPRNRDKTSPNDEPFEL